MHVKTICIKIKTCNFRLRINYAQECDKSKLKKLIISKTHIMFKLEDGGGNWANFIAMSLFIK